MLSNKMDLRVAIITFILNSSKQLEKDLLLDYFSSNISKKESSKKEIYKIINSRCKITNYDEVDLLINKYHKDYKEIYIKDKNKNLYCYELIHKISKSFISHRDSKIVLKYWELKEDEFLGEYNGLNKIAMWNTLSREITVDILVCQYMIDNNIEDYRYLQCYDSIIHIEDLQLDRILSKGVADTHMHLGAGINFEIKWNELMNDEKYKNDYKILDMSIVEEITNDDLRRYRYICIVYRILLSEYIFNFQGKGFKEYINEFNLKDLLEIFNKDINQAKILMQETKKRINAHKSNTKNYYKYSLNNNDFLNSIIKNIDADIEINLENIFLFESLKYINKNTGVDKEFEMTFYKYILIKNIFFRVSTQNDLIEGLDRFSSSYKRSILLNNENNIVYLVLRTQTKSRNLKKLEVRCIFPDHKNKIKKGLKSFFEIYLHMFKEEQQVPQIGIIYSFKKYKDEGDKCWINYIDTNDINQLNYQKNRIQYINQLEALLELRESIPYLSNYIIGIDASSIENNTEPWVFAPVFKRARDSKRQITILNNRRINNINTLGFTFHVGEEFRHILSGLRRIDEVITHLNFKSGDRIGHGIALGIDINKWYKKNPIVILPRIEYIENLLWVWDILTHEKTDYNSDINYLERKIINEAKNIYCTEQQYDLRGINIYMLYQAYIDKFKDTNINCKYKQDKLSDFENIYMNYVFCLNLKECAKGNWNSEKLGHSNHCEVYLSRMNEPIEVVIEDTDVELFIFIQDKIRKKIAQYGIIVETNPTSNRSIGELDNIFEHYIKNLNNLDYMKNDNIMVTINTDDPSVFNTNINNEYSYIFYSLLKNGYDRGQCLEWIDNVRKVALDQSFIKTRDLDGKTLEKEINEIMKYLE
ncbi:MAG: hypothetical protein KH083_07080 [Intestinibacter bartlettii]|uniref:hypothetical protein n=1 Tax=Intestinibacter bartlettii TaxID=261299 RepID=UPI0024328602|nr:hypothetical protein [Intestinibacter bartlettii]MBS7148158.1 hypothetical protein [Intestinibacter bartlettii]